MSEIERRKRDLVDTFRSLYSSEPSSGVRAPGRAELLGTDTDDHLGYVLTMGIPLDTWIVFSPNGSDRVRVHSMNLDRGFEYRLGGEPTEPAPSWDRYITGVSRVLLQRGISLAGVDAVLHSTVPLGGGLSSSASLEVAVAHMFLQTAGIVLPALEVALACQKAENQSAGVGCGILDQYSSVFAREGTALLLDCRSLTHVEVKIASDIQVIVCDTNFPRTLAGSEYGLRKEECDMGTALLRELDSEIRTLRDVNTPLFDRYQAKLPLKLRNRCRFILEENQRVVDFMAALVKDDRLAMRNLCELSFVGERDLYEKTVPAMEKMFTAMMYAEGVIAARQSGGGFGGCMIAYVQKQHVSLFIEQVRTRYQSESGLVPSFYVTSPTEGAGPLAL